MSERSVTLYCQEGGSDKVYQIHLRQAPNAAGWLVDRANGPRGKALRPGTETPAPVSLEAAQDIFERLLRSKLLKGYHEGENGTAYSSSEFAGLSSGHRQQLPTAAGADQVARLLVDDAWALQEKANGERRSLRIEPNGEVRGINKLGLYCAVPASWKAAFAGVALDGGAFIDGEQIGEEFHAFDVLDMYGNDLRASPFAMRAAQIQRLLDHHGPAGLATVLKPISVVTGTAAKQEAASEIQARNGEGFVMKRLDAPYEPGRSDDAFKFKFTETCSCIVLARNQQRSVNIGLFTSEENLQPVGNVTIPPNHAIPDDGCIVEVQYLYYNPMGAFEQPVYLHPRTDVDRSECHFGQVQRLKPDTAMPTELWNVDGDSPERRAEAPRG